MAKSSKRAKLPPTPTAKSVIICDEAVQEKDSDKWTLVGIFNRLLAPGVPAVRDQIAVYFCLTGMLGEYHLTLELAHLNSRQVIGRAEGEVNCQDKLGTFEIAVKIRGVQFTQKGKHVFRLLMNDQLIVDKELYVEVAE